ncbi:HAD family hydrolase [Paenibacillus filicis]|uniref:Phosphoserine phosphatase n=1 Tax=Paenibacillus gyeongsangnamensis TaxID=3388067 RepID=A0ABT4QKK2_9BACL|nr:HAD family hydrolase [Paenibacillus filicis]MCZ8517393.1 HAD family hydrolase [Paenibacillus filicis]
MSNIKAIIFDLDNTLLWDEKSINEAFQATCRMAADKASLQPAVLEKNVREAAQELFASMEIYEWANMIEVTYLEALWGRFNSGHHPAFHKLEQWAPVYQKESWTCGLQKTGIDDPAFGQRLAERFAEERRNHPLVYDDTFHVLDHLHKQYPLLLLTNGAPDLQQEKIDSILGLADYFDHIIISGTFGAGKPAPSIFQHAMELLGISPEEGMMVGDNLDTDIKGAGGIGMRSVWINHEGRTAPAGNLPTYEIGRLSELLDILQPALLQQKRFG